MSVEDSALTTPGLKPDEGSGSGTPRPTIVKSACIFGQFIVTSPNMASIPTPQWANAVVRLRADYRFGEDDYTCWPQDYIEEFCHLGAIPSKPSDSEDPAIIMWYNASRDDFVPYPGSLYDGFGTLAPSKYHLLEQLCSALSKEVRMFLRASTGSNHVLVSLVKAMEHACSRLEWCGCLFTEMCFAVAELQRYYLEVRGLLDYLTVYKPRMDGLSSPACEVAKCIGAFTTKPRVAQDFVEAGLPVYLVRPLIAISSAELSPDDTSKIVQPLRPSDSVELHDADPAFPTIYKGRAHAPAKHAAIHRYSRTWMVYKDPHSSDSIVSTDAYDNHSIIPNASQVRTMADLMAQQLPVDSGPSIVPQQNISVTPTASSQRVKPKKASEKGRNPWDDYRSDLLPPSVPTWISALRSVKHDDKRLVRDASSADGFRHYALFDPHLFVTPATDAKKTLYLILYIRLRPALHHHLRRHPALMLRIQSWRELLELSRETAKNENSYGANARQKFQQVLGPVLRSVNPELLSMDPEELPSASWRNHILTASHLPPHEVFHQVLWELNEINFRLELLLLDKRASNASVPAASRLDWVLNCFVDRQLLPSTIPNENEGLVADHWGHRVPYTLAFIQVLRQWRHAPQSLRDLQRSELNGHIQTPERLSKLEEAAASFYAQMFWNYFGRAPILPRRIR